jgi:hypothetical protein
VSRSGYENVDEDVADSDEAHALRHVAPALRDPSDRRVDLPYARAGVLERAKRFDNRPRISLVALGRHRQRLVEGAAAVRTRERERRHEPGRLSPREHAQQLDDRR